MKGSDEELLGYAEEADKEVEGKFVRRRRCMEDFRYDEVQARYWDTTTGTLLGDKSVNGAIPKEFWPSVTDGKKVKLVQPAIAINDVDTGLTVEGSTWWPGMPRFINDKVVNDRGTITKRGAVTYNSYVAPEHEPVPEGVTADRWVEHVKKLWPDPVEHEHFFDFAAHMIQRPDQKVNHGVVMAGEQGIGKDTALLPLRTGVGAWNAAEIEPDAIESSYNPYIRSVMLVINEVRPHNEDHRASNFYNQLKPILASPPDMLPMDVKYQNTIYIRNLCHVILTTNDPLTMYIPPEDRRLFVMTSPLPDPKRNPVFVENYFPEIYSYLYAGGMEAAIAWLVARDLSKFDAGAPPPMTSGKEAIVDSAHQVRRSAANDVFESMVEGYFGGVAPDIIFARDVRDYVMQGNFFDDRDAALKAIDSKGFHFKMSEFGYDMLRNPDATEWRCGAFRSRTAFIKKTIERGEKIRRISAELQRRPLAFSEAPKTSKF